jgi:uncharacterized protein (DUF4415 family)
MRKQSKAKSGKGVSNGAKAALDALSENPLVTNLEKALASGDKKEIERARDALHESTKDLPPLDPLLIEFIRALARDNVRRDRREREQQIREQIEAERKQREESGIGYGYEFDLDTSAEVVPYAVRANSLGEALLRMNDYRKENIPEGSIAAFCRMPDEEFLALALAHLEVRQLEGPPKAPRLQELEETVILRLDREVLDFFQNDRPGWEGRINAVLRKAAGKSDD